MSIYQHFRKEEHQFVDKILQAKDRVEETYEPFVSVFLTPRQINVASALFSKLDNVSLYQSPISLERKRCIIAYDVPKQTDFKESVLTIHYPSKFYQLKHSSILGAVLSCGVKRVHWRYSHRRQSLANYCGKFYCPIFKGRIKKIGLVKVSLEESSRLLQPINQAQKIDTLVSSQRIDVLVATAFNMSRHLAKKLVEQGSVTLNWAICDKPDTTIEEKDVISVRGYGRVLLQSINGITQKGKIKLALYLYRNKK